MRIDGVDLFGSGPSELTPASPQRQLLRRALPGLNGEMVLDMGARARALRQTGRLRADTPETLQALLAAIAARLDGRVHRLTDNHGTVYENVLLASFELTSPVQLGEGAWADYRAEYLQLP